MQHLHVSDLNVSLCWLTSGAGIASLRLLLTKRTCSTCTSAGPQQDFRGPHPARASVASEPVLPGRPLDSVGVAQLVAGKAQDEKKAACL